MGTINDRIKAIVDELYNGNVSEFERASDIKPNTIKNIIGGRLTKPSYNLLECIVRNNVLLSSEWLLTGEGSMLKEDKTGVTLLSHSKVPETLSSQDIILYDISAAANLKTLLGDKTQNILGKISIPDIPKCDGAVYVKGDSMYPLLKSGDIIAYKEVHNFDSVVKGEMYLISFELDGDEYLTVKYVNHSEKEGCIKLVSYNPHHDPMDIPVSSIYAMALVKVSIRMNTMR